MDQDTYNPMNLAGRRYIVTGASSGIGRAVAILLSHLGSYVICVGRDQNRLHDTVSALVGEGHFACSFDLTDVAAIPQWMEGLAKEVGGVNGFVHAAGIQSLMPLRLLTPDKSRTVFLVNTEAGLALAKGFMHHRVYIGSYGSMVFISSVMGQVGAAGRIAYSASKGALEGMVRSLAIECAPKGVRVNCVAPAFVQTPMLSELERIWGEDWRLDLMARHPLGIGNPEDVANAAAFLLADTGRWITGTVLTVDGGYTAQ